MGSFSIKNELKNLPTCAGVYIMHKKGGEVIYVGKAKNLKNRVKQYFQKGTPHTSKIEMMIQNIDYFEYIVVDNELESLILESNLIKEYRPRYNTLLKDDKNYPYIKMTTSEKYPRIFMVHRKERDNETYFGPYMSYGIVNDVLDFVKDNYKLRLCSTSIDKSKKEYKSCLYYHLGMCLAPCVKRCDSKYKKVACDVKKLLKGDIKDIISELTKQMNKLSNKELYEEAIKIRDKIKSIEDISEKQKIDSREEVDKDVVGMYRKNDVALVQIFEIRAGNIIDRDIHILNIDTADTDEDIIKNFIKQYYNEPALLPKEIWLPITIDEKKLFEDFVNRDKIKCKLVIPKIGEKHKLIELATKNAKIQYDQRVSRHIREEKNINVAMDILKRLTGLININRLESYDISNTMGTLSVASMVVWENGNFKKNDYRKFRIKTIEGADDYGSIREVLERRIKHIIDEDYKFGKMPSILLIDGGEKQVESALMILNKYRVEIPVMGMVKDDNHRTRGLIYKGQEIDLKDYKELFMLITKIQDETHRFAIEYHRHLRGKEMLRGKK